MIDKLFVKDWNSQKNRTFMLLHQYSLMCWC